MKLINKLKIKLKNKMEYIFGLAGVIIWIVFLIGAIIHDGDFNPVFRTVSSLADEEGKTLFSIGFIIAGSLCIPFYIKLEKSLKLVANGENYRRIATAVSIVSCMAIGLIGVIPDKNFPLEFAVFHNIMAFISFGGTSAYIVLFSISMRLKKEYNLFIHFLGVLVVIFFGLLLVLRLAIVEWILTILILVWIFSTIVHSLMSKEEAVLK